MWYFFIRCLSFCDKIWLTSCWMPNIFLGRDWNDETDFRWGFWTSWLLWCLVFCLIMCCRKVFSVIYFQNEPELWSSVFVHTRKGVTSRSSKASRFPLNALWKLVWMRNHTHTHIKECQTVCVPWIFASFGHGLLMETICLYWWRDLLCDLW